MQDQDLDSNGGFVGDLSVGGTDPAAPNPWTQDDLNNARQFYADFIQQHGISSWGDPSDGVRYYMTQRRNGLGHDQALHAALGSLGWDKASAPKPDPVSPPPPSPQSASVTASGVGPTPSPQPAGGAPTFTAPGYTPPPKFSYADFVAPDPSKLDQDREFQYSLKTEQDAIQRSAAARGILNTGGTIYDLLSNAKDLTASRYANLYNRDLSTYQTNRQNALGEYNTNYGTQYTDPFKYSYMGTQDAYNSNQHNYDLTTQYNWYRNLFDWQKDSDLFDRKFRLLSAA